MVSPIITLHDISKTFVSENGKPLKALDSVNMTIIGGEFVILLGHSGCGKTTLLNLVAGLEQPDAGSIITRQQGTEYPYVPCVFQHYTLFPWLTVSDNVSFGLQVRGMTKSEYSERTTKLLVQVGLENAAHLYPHELSGGMRQRAAIAQALAVDPPLLLMDEPFGALDEYTRREMQELITGIWEQQKMTILFVTHNIDEALTLGSRIILFQGKPGRNSKDLCIDLPRPRNPMTPDFLSLHVELRSIFSGHYQQ